MTQDAFTPQPTPEPQYQPTTEQQCITPQNAWQMILDHNPFYLLSVLLMLIGCRAITSSLHVEAGDLGKLVLLLGILNVYECMIIGLGIVLLPRQGVERDGRILLLLESLFLVDATFLNAETVLTNPGYGALINLVLLMLAIGKAMLVIRICKINIRMSVLVFLGAQLALLWALPLYFRQLGPAGTVPPLAIYAVWWIIGLLPVIYDLLVRQNAPSSENAAAPADPLRILTRIYFIMPFVSLIAHLGFIHWVYQIPFYMADLCPVLCGVAINSSRWPTTKFVTRKDIRGIQVLLPFIALLFALSNPQMLTISVWGKDIEPVYFLIAGIVFSVTYIFAFRWLVWYFVLLVIVGGGMMLGPTLTQVLQWAASVIRKITQLFDDMLPTSAAGWGIAAMLMSFMLLSVGGTVSYIKGHKAGKTL